MHGRMFRAKLESLCEVFDCLWNAKLKLSPNKCTLFWILASCDKEKTAFSVTGGLWLFHVMPFRVCNAPTTFERLMDHVLCLVYFHDIIMHGRMFRAKLASLRQVFDCLWNAKLKLSPNKCTLFCQKFNYLGHILSKKGITADSSKIKTVQTWPHPKCLADLRSFLGLCSYYHKFIQNYAEISRLLHHLTEKNQTFQWHTQAEESFNELKRMLENTRILAFSTEEGMFILDIDEAT
jgi:hypothetical protein